MVHSLSFFLSLKQIHHFYFISYSLLKTKAGIKLSFFCSQPFGISFSGLFPGPGQQIPDCDAQHLAEAAQRTQRDVRASPFDAQQPHGAYTAARGQRLHRKALSAAKAPDTRGDILFRRAQHRNP